MSCRTDAHPALASVGAAVESVQRARDQNTRIGIRQRQGLDALAAQACRLAPIAPAIAGYKKAAPGASDAPSGNINGRRMRGVEDDVFEHQILARTKMG